MTHYTGRVALRKFCPESYYGAELRNIYDDRYQGIRQRVDDAYAAIDPEGTATFNPASLRASFETVLPKGRYASALPAPVSSILRTMEQDIKEGRMLSYLDLQDMRTQLTDLASQAKNSGDRPLLRLSTGTEKQLGQLPLCRRKRHFDTDAATRVRHLSSSTGGSA